MPTMLSKIYFKKTTTKEHKKREGRFRARHHAAVSPRNRSLMSFSESFQRAGEQIPNEWTWTHSHTLYTHTHTHSDPTTEEGPDFLALRTPGSRSRPYIGSACGAAESEPLGGTGGARCHAVCPYGFGWKDPSLSPRLSLSTFASVGFHGDVSIGRLLFLLFLLFLFILLLFIFLLIVVLPAPVLVQILLVALSGGSGRR